MSEEKTALEFDLCGGVVHPWHIDQFGHMHVRWYAHFFDVASFMFWNHLELDQTKMIAEYGAHSVTAKATTQFKAELQAGDCICLHGRIVRIGGKGLTLQFRLAGAAIGEDYGMYETVEVFVDAKTYQSCEIPTDVRCKLEALGWIGRRRYLRRTCADRLGGSLTSDFETFC